MRLRLVAALLPFTFIMMRAHVEPQIMPQQHAQLRTALARHDLIPVTRSLREMMRSAPAAFTKNNYDYLLARVLDWQGQKAEASEHYQKIIARRSPLAPYALWHQAALARGSGRPAEEAKLLRRLIDEYSGFLHRAQAIERLGDSYYQAGQYQSAVAILRPLASPRGSGRDDLSRIGESQLALKETAAARATFESLLAGQTDDAALRAVAGLDQLDAEMRTPLGELERLRRARIYQINRHFADARRHWQAIVNDYPQSARRAEALFQIGRGYFLEENYPEAIRWYERAGEEFPDTDEGEQGFYYVGHSYQALNDVDRAIKRYDQFLEEYPESKYRGYAYLNAIDTLRSGGRFEEALKWAARAQRESREPFIVTRALFDQAKIRLTEENYSAALIDLAALRARNLNLRGLVATTNPAEITFLRGYTLEKLGRFEEAITEYLTLSEGRTAAPGYYGHQATARLRELSSNLRAQRTIAARRESFLAQARAAQAAGNAMTARLAASQALRLTNEARTRDEMLGILRAAYLELPAYQLPTYTLIPAGRRVPLGDGETPPSDASHQTIADELIFLGLYDEGAAELMAARPATASARDWTYSLALYCARGDCAERTIRFSEPILNSLPDDYRPELLPREWAEIFFPLPYREELEAHATPRGVDPRFVLSIARQESRYDPGVKSHAAARGLLQFISSTSDQIAAQLNLKDFEQNDLYQPEVAVLFGSQYLKNLFDEFKSPQAVAAAYNGSEDSVRRWIARARSNEVDRFTIEVAKRETKDYVFKVVNYFRAYQAIYPGITSAPRPVAGSK